MKSHIVRRFGVCVLVGALVVAISATTGQAVLVRYNNGGAGWYDATNNWNQDILTFKMDGSVVTNSANTPGLNVLGQNADSFTFAEADFFWWGTEELDTLTMAVGANVGYVSGSVGDVWSVGNLSDGYQVGATLADGRLWADSTSTPQGRAGMANMGLYSYVEWSFDTSGYIGLYADDVDGRHYGWAYVDVTLFSAVHLLEFAFETEPNTPVTAPEPTTLGLLALGAAALLAHRKRA